MAWSPPLPSSLPPLTSHIRPLLWFSTIFYRLPFFFTWERHFPYPSILIYPCLCPSSSMLFLFLWRWHESICLLYFSFPPLWLSLSLCPFSPLAGVYLVSALVPSKRARELHINRRNKRDMKLYETSWHRFRRVRRWRKRLYTTNSRTTNEGGLCLPSFFLQLQIKPESSFFLHHVLSYTRMDKILHT